ncbi:MAG: MFS transporter [Chloroflexi bacterium]|nr:MFS transporter [Chloroflexota bacterium]
MQRKGNGVLLAALFFGVLMAAMDIAIVAPALPAIRDAFGVDDRAASWVFSIYLLFNLIGTPIMAKGADRYGRRNVYILDIGLFVMGTLIAGLAPSFGVVLVGRALQGLGSGGLFPIAAAVIGDVVPPERRGRTLGLIGATFGVAFLIGPILGGILLFLGGWRLIFMAVVPMAGVLIPWAWHVIPNTRVPQQAPFDWIGTLLLSAALVALAYGVNQVEAQQGLRALFAAHTGGFVALGLGLMGLLLAWEHRVPDPILPWDVARSWRALLALILTFGAGFIEGGMMFIPTLAVEAFHISEHQASFRMIPLAFALGVGAPLFGRMLDARGPRTVLLIGTGLSAIGLAVLGLLPMSWVAFYAGLIAVGLGLSALLGAPIRYIMLQEARLDERASAQALISLVTKIGHLLSGAFVGAMAASFGGGILGYQRAYQGLLLLAAVLVVLAARVPPRPQTAKEDVTNFA